ncbi:MAG TPA: hypothetical protein VMU06_10160 [Stellaceae bacterium]|nr:hypothetical protein [Stellaceae bacterium]
MSPKKLDEHEFDEVTRDRIARARAKQDEWRQWRHRVRDVLNTVWDPIGVYRSDKIEDESDEYAKHIAAMIRQGRTDEEPQSYLACTVIEDMGLGRKGEEERMKEKEAQRATVAALRALGPAPQ